MCAFNQTLFGTSVSFASLRELAALEKNILQGLEETEGIFIGWSWIKQIFWGTMDKHSYGGFQK